MTPNCQILMDEPTLEHIYDCKVQLYVYFIDLGGQVVEIMKINICVASVEQQLC